MLKLLRFIKLKRMKGLVGCGTCIYSLCENVSKKDESDELVSLKVVLLYLMYRYLQNVKILEDIIL